MGKPPIRPPAGANSAAEKLRARVTIEEAMDLLHLTRSELLRLVNGTPAGAVLTRSRLRGQIDAGGAAFLDDAGRVHFVRYVRWLARQADLPAAEAADYLEQKRRQAARNRAATKAAQDIAPIPDVADWPRRERALASPRVFCETYAPRAFRWPWSDAHLRALEILEDVARNGGLFAYLMFRGGGKTTLARWVTWWILLANLARSIVGISGSEEKAKKQLLKPVKVAVLENRLLLADFPEAVYPLWCLENSSKRQQQQHCNNHLTHVTWEPARIDFPWLSDEDLPASFAARGAEPAARGAVYAVAGLDGEIRGEQKELPDGTVLRPTLALLDDPQTRRSARSSTMTDHRLELVESDVRYLAGPDQTISCVAMCTKIVANDLSSRLADPDKCPDWESQTTKFLTRFPDNLRLWDEYWQLRRGRGAVGRRESNAFYKRHRADMDAGAAVSWEHAYDRRTELSAVQHAMNLWLARPTSFFAELQNDPQSEQLRDDVLTAAQVAGKTTGRRRGVVPAACPCVTAFIDVHDRLLFWAAVAWQQDLTGHVVDYGGFPEQTRRWYTLRRANPTLTQRYRGRSVEAAITAGLRELVAALLAREWPRAGGGVIRVGRLLVDMGYKPEIVEAVKHAVGGETMWLSKGVGLKAAHKPMSEYRRRAGTRHGCHWYVPNIRGTREFPHVAVDVNYWKSWVHAALAAPAGEAGGLSLFGRKAAEHELLAEHVANSEAWVDVTARGRTVREWSPKPGKPDNHWLDCLVGCAAAASQRGCAAPGQQAGAQRGRKRYTQADLDRRGR